MGHYTAAHWGIYEVETKDGAPRILPFSGDPDPSPIGFHQLADEVTRLRVRRPAFRRSWLEGGPGAATELRGRDDFVELDWPEALDRLARELDRVRTRFGNEAIYGGSYGWSSSGRFHHAQSQVHRFLNAIGGFVRHQDSYSLGAGRVLMPHIVATMDELSATSTSWEVMEEHTKLFVSFGGVPLKNAQISSGGAGVHRVRNGLRRMAQAGTRFVNVGPVNDNLQTGGVVEWLPVRPNTDTALMLALAYVLRDEGLHDRAFLDRCCTGYDVFERYLTGAADRQPKDPRWAAAITGADPERIVALAREMAGTRTMLNIAWSLQRAAHGEQPFWMLVTLACMLGQIGLPGGGFALGYGAMNAVGSIARRIPGPTLPQGENRVRAFIPVARIADMLLHPGEPFTYDGGTYEFPKIRLVYWAGGNPFHHHQDLNRLIRAWQQPDTVVVNEQYWSPVARFADIVLPATTSLERDDIGFATRESHLIAMKQAMPPFAESRDDYTIFSELAARLGATDVFTEGRTAQEWLECLYERCRARAPSLGLPDFATFWDRGIVPLGEDAEPVVLLQAFRADPERNRLGTPSGKIEIFSEQIASFGLPDCPGHPTWLEPFEWLGARGAPGDALHLLSDQPERRLHSQLDASPHSMDGKIDGREAVLLNPADAAVRGIADGDVVELFNARGRCLAAARLTEEVMPGVAKLNTGAWFDPDFATGLEKHGNPNVLTLDRGASGLSQGCAAQTCLVQVRGRVNQAPPVTAFELPPLSA